MPGLDLTSYESILKEYYTDEMVYRMTYQDNPFMALVPKMEDFGGKSLPIPIIYGNPQGRSSSFTYAKANKTPGKYTDFALTRAKDYGLASLDGETLEASKGNKAAFLEAATTEIDGILESVTRSAAVSLFRNGSGSIGRIAATTNVATAVIDLTSPEEVTNFEVGMKLVASTADGGGVVKNTAGTQNSASVISVDRQNGKVTMSVTLDSFGAQDWAAGDYLFVQGDYDSKMKGLDAWIPATRPTAGDNFFGVDRSTDDRLCGNRLDISNMPLEEGLNLGVSRLNREGGKADYCFMNYNRYKILENSLGSKVQYIDLNTKVGIGFRGIVINSNKGPVTVLADQNCQDDTAWMIQMNVWKLYSLGAVPKIIKHDGINMLRESDSDGVEIRTGYYAQLGCRAPGYNLRLKLA